MEPAIFADLEQRLSREGPAAAIDRLGARREIALTLLWRDAPSLEGRGHAVESPRTKALAPRTDAADEVAAHFSTVAKDNGGSEIAPERMGKKRLAFEIQKLREGHYVCMKFDGTPDCAKEIVRQMRLHENVMRALLIRL